MKLASLSTWRGDPVWTCRLCPHTATSRARMAAHGRDYHRLKVDFEVPEAPAEDAPATAEEETGDGTHDPDAS